MAKKRKINEGLAKYNRIRSGVSKSFKEAGRKASRKELDKFTGDIYQEFRGTSDTPDQDDIIDFLSGSNVDVFQRKSDDPKYDPLNYSSNFDWFYLQERLQNDLANDINVIIDASLDGSQVVEFNSNELDYNAHLQEIYRDLNKMKFKTDDRVFAVSKTKKNGKTFLKYTLINTTDIPEESIIEEEDISDELVDLPQEFRRDKKRKKRDKKEKKEKEAPEKESESDKKIKDREKEIELEERKAATIEKQIANLERLKKLAGKNKALVKKINDKINKLLDEF